ncbi:RNA polymerase sigma factor [bacterium]|nr:RNA polymerase sigma factor [bacterium]MBU1074314.1 RNA polymerase sigma factor [bacterium]MBU1674154.1 RNA polymerase sigma factor [bacterium]
MDQLESMYRKHAPAVYRFALGLCGERSAAEDLVSETFVHLVAGSPRIETVTALAYLLAIARNTYLSGLRRRKREVPLRDEIPAGGLDPDMLLDDRARLAKVMRALQDLSEGERSALLLRVDHELSYEDVAAALGTTAGAAKVRVHRARLRLARALECEGVDHGARSDT